ncbi:MAG: phage integrase SAM-like domain-containing protein [Mucilaginibacter sp.]
MATVNFYLDKADKQGQSLILMTYLAGRQKFRYSTKFKITASEWIKKKQRLKDSNVVNAQLDKLESLIREAQNKSLLSYNEIDFEFVKQTFYDNLGGKKEKKKVTFLQSFQEYIDLSKTTKKQKTTDRYVTTFRHIKEFGKTKRYELNFEKINQHFYENFTHYLLTEKKQLNNTVDNYIKTLKAFMNFSIERGYCKPSNEVRKFRVLKDEGELIYLTEDELLKLYHLELSNQKLKVVRDNFCFACFTGLRYSDITKLQPENIKDDYLEIKTEKTRDFLRIPLVSYAKELLNKNGGRLPKLYTNQKTNEYLKDLGALAEFNEMIQVIKYRGVEKVEFLEPKYKFLCTHTARRTFVTLSLEKGLRPELVMSITGHKDYKTFKKYIKLTDKVKLAEMNNVWTPKMRVA